MRVYVYQQHILEEKIIGGNDAKRIARLSEIETNISNPERGLNVDYTLIEECLEKCYFIKNDRSPKNGSHW